MKRVARLVVIGLSMSLMGHFLDVTHGVADWLDGGWMVIEIALLGSWVVIGEAVWEGKTA